MQAQKGGRSISVMLVLALVAVALGGAYVFGITRIVVPLFADPIGAKAFPSLIAAGLFVSAILMFIEHVQARKSGADAEPWPTISWVVVGVVAWTVIYLEVFEWLGYTLSTLLYLLPLMFYFNRGKTLANIAVAVGFCVVSYICLAVLLDAQLPKGILFETLFP